MTSPEINLSTHKVSIWIGLIQNLAIHAKNAFQNANINAYFEYRGTLLFIDLRNG